MRCAAALLCYGSIAAFGGPAYSVQTIQVPSGMTNIALNGINTSGQVAGGGDLGPDRAAFIGSPSGSTIIPTTPCPSPMGRGGPIPFCVISTTGAAINDSGQVTGIATISTALGEEPFLGNASGITVLPLDGIGSAISSSGLVAAYSMNHIQSYILTLSSVTQIPFPSGSSVVLAYGINSSGQVTGIASGGAFLGTISGSILLPPPPGWTFVLGSAINDAGQVVGVGSGPHFGQAIIGTVAGSTPIPLPPGATYSGVGFQSINNSGVVVGLSDAGGWIWDSVNGTRLLTNLVPAGWNISNAESISNNGLILATGSFNGVGQLVELIPSAAPATPVPGTLLLLISGLGALGLATKLWSRA